MIEINDYRYDDLEHVISRFKELINPNNEEHYSNRSFNQEFVELSKHLYHFGYQIKQFPNLLAHPTSLKAFAYDEIRSYIQNKRGEMGTVTWDERRKLILSLEFLRVNQTIVPVPDDLQQIIQLISLRDSTFENQSDNEKLRTIADVIENLLKQPNGKFIELDETAFCGLFSNTSLREFRKQLQAFRHSHSKAIESREINLGEKQFLIHLGIVLIIRINDVLKEERNID